MLQEFITQDYFLIENNVVVNSVLWNGNTSQWTPPQGSIAIVKDTTPALNWNPVMDDTKNPPIIIDYILVETVGSGDIGFTWDGSVLTTNQPKPEIPVGTSDLQTV